MKYVLDASVAVASLRPNEPLHSASVAYLSPLLKGIDAIIVPAIFRIEVASALARAGFAAPQVERFVEAFLSNATVVTIGPQSSRRIQAVSVATRLRAADAIYVWLAETKALPLVTADREIHQRAAARCQVIGP
ncbi:MAG TPA: type II toxin-antitoxin system VapC family toxin [Polyangiaceae bacterium]|jgi:predicted nucleic acid-binding protein|nr:type II toxin-antitoxin system VapC family toxin [Polyangiaceae bacterium]